MRFTRHGLCLFIFTFFVILGLQHWMTTASFAVEVRSAQELSLALEDSDVKFISIKNDIVGNFKAKPGRDLRISGNGHKLISFEKESYLFDFIDRLTGSDKIIIENAHIIAQKAFKFGINFDVTLSGLKFQSSETTLYESKPIAIRSTASRLSIDNCEFNDYLIAIQQIEKYLENANYLSHSSFNNCNIVFFTSERRSSVDFVNCSFDNIGFLAGYDNEKSIKGKYIFDILTLNNAKLAYAVPFINLSLVSDDNSDLLQLFQQRDNLYKKINEIRPDFATKYSNKYAEKNPNILHKELLSILDSIDTRFAELNDIDQWEYDSSGIVHEEINDLFELIFELLSLPIDTAVDNLKRYVFLGEMPQQMIEKNPFIASFVMVYFLRHPRNDVRVLSAACDGLLLGDGANGEKSVIDLAKSIDIPNPDFFFRESLNTFKDWIVVSGEVLNKAREYLNNFEKQKGRKESFEYFEMFSLLKDLSVVNSKILRAFLFDMPMQVVFFVGYAKSNSDDVNNVFSSARQIAKYYPVSRKLCVLSGTNSVSKELIERWKKMLKKDRFEELTAILQTEPSDLFDQPNIEDFFRKWY